MLEAQSHWRERIESQPTRFLVKELPGLLREAADRLGRFLGTCGERLVFTDNATAGVNSVLRAIPWKAGDEVLLSRHAYVGVRNATRHIAGRAGARVVEAPVPFPLQSADEIVAAFEGSMGPRTRLLICDHVASSTSVIHPVSNLAALCRSRGVPLLVDGAHAPGMLDFSLDSSGCDWYAGNCHKWMCAPRGCGFLWAAPGREADLHPPVISVNDGRDWHEEFAWQGTRDPSAWLAVTSAIEFWERFGPDNARGYRDRLALEGARLAARAAGTELPVPPGMLSAMVSVPLHGLELSGAQQAAALHDLLLERHGLEVPVFEADQQLWLRVSAQIYNEMEDFERLAAALSAGGGVSHGGRIT